MCFRRDEVADVDAPLGYHTVIRRRDLLELRHIRKTVDVGLVEINPGLRRVLLCNRAGIACLLIFALLIRYDALRGAGPPLVSGLGELRLGFPDLQLGLGSLELRFPSFQLRVELGRIDLRQDLEFFNPVADIDEPPRE